MFWKVEGRTGLYTFFKTVCDVYGLIPADNYTIPPEAEGLEASQAAPPTILRREASGSGPQEKEPRSAIEGMADHTLSTAGTTKRHRHSPSVGVTAVQTVMEENEEDSELNPRASVIRIEAPEEKEEAPAQEEIERPASAQSSENSFVEVEAPSSPSLEADDLDGKAEEPEAAGDREEPESSEKVESNGTQEKAEEEKKNQPEVTEKADTEESKEPGDGGPDQVKEEGVKDDEKNEEEKKDSTDSDAPANKETTEKAS